jgi:hypothetical protein
MTWWCWSEQMTNEPWMLGTSHRQMKNGDSKHESLNMAAERLDLNVRRCG